MSAEKEYLTAQQVADYLGIQLPSVYTMSCRGSMPAPDLYLMKRPLWLPETIDAYKASRFKRRRKTRTKRKHRVKAPSLAAPERGVKVRQGATNNGVPLEIDEETALAIAGALREGGLHCTKRDVVELAAADPDTLDYERRSLQTRILIRLRARS